MTGAGDHYTLHITEEGQVEVIQLLAARGAEISCQDSYQETSLHWAARYDCTAAVKLLLCLGADTTIKNWEGKTAEDVASGDARSVLKTDTDTDIENWAKADTESKKGSMFKRIFKKN